MTEIRWFNKNKSCIEILSFRDYHTFLLTFNKNKSCIEMLEYIFDIREYASLIRTRVVLKSYDTLVKHTIKIKFNKNKSCIEILEKTFISICRSCLIRTRVVLKFQSCDTLFALCFV